MNSPDAGPVAHNTERTSWSDLPAEVKATIAAQAGGSIVHAASTTGGFSPGFAGIVTLERGEQQFVKAASASRHPHSIGIARSEIASHQCLPPQTPTAKLLWHLDDGDWALAAFDVIDGATPELPWQQDTLALALSAVRSLGSIQVADDAGLDSFAVRHHDLFTTWAQLARRLGDERDVRERPGGTWALKHLDTLVAWEADAASASDGTSLVHGDIRADNLMVSAQGEVLVVDWPYASRGAPWLDVLWMAPSIEMQGGPTAADVFGDQPWEKRPSHEHVRAMVTAMLGFFLVNSWDPPPPSIPTLRDFQAAQAWPALRWLGSLEPQVAPSDASTLRVGALGSR